MAQTEGAPTSPLSREEDRGGVTGPRGQDGNPGDVSSSGGEKEFGPCLICGEDLLSCRGEEVSLLEEAIKEEVIGGNDPEETVEQREEDFQREEDNSGEFSNAGDGASRGGSKKREGGPGIPGGSESGTKWTQTEGLIYQWFLKWFKIRWSVVGRKKKGPQPEPGWEGTSRKDPLPFCGLCRRRLMTLLELQWKIEELEEQIQGGLRDLRKMADSSEEIFRSRGVYDKDGRYRRVREQMVTDFKNTYPRRAYRKKGRKPTDKEWGMSLRRKTEDRPYFDNEGGNGPEDEGASEPEFLGPEVGNSRIAPANPASLEEDDDIKPDIGDINSGITEEMREKCFPEEETTLMIPEVTEENPKRSGRKRKKASGNSKKGTRALNTDAICQGDYEEDDEGDYSRKKSKGSGCRRRPPSKRRKSKKTKKPAEEDWIPSGDEDGGENGSDGDLPADQLKRGNYAVDPERRTLTYKTLVFHQIEPFAKNCYRCSECGEEVEHRNIRIRCHYLQAHTDTLTCKQCGFRAAWHQTLKEHVRVVHKGLNRSKRSTPAPCRICGKPLGMSHRKRHEWTHKNEEEKREAIARNDKDLPWDRRGGKQFQCDECGREFAVAKDLTRHKEHVHGSEESRESRKELCPECGEKFISLLQHRKRVHGVEAKSYTCLEPGCGKVCKSLTQLTQHKDAIHRKIRPHKCTLCPRTFTKEKGLKNHMNLHNGIRPLKCPHCPMAFTIKSNLQRHQLTYHAPGSAPKRKSFRRGPSMLGTDVRKRDLINQGIYLPPSALASWAAGREPTSHFPQEPLPLPKDVTGHL